MKAMNVECNWCKKSFQKKPADIKRTKRNFCSKNCSGKYRIDKSNKSFSDNFQKVESGCWEWKGCKNKYGYGVKRVNGKSVLAHRASYMIYNGEIGLEHVCHKCDNPSCVNPNHLFLGTHQDNMSDMATKGRKNTKLSFDDVKAIRDSNLTNKELSKIHDVSERTIRHAKNTSNWLFIPPK